MATPKPPTVRGISELLRMAGWERSERQIGGFSTGFTAEKSLPGSADSAVIVRHRRWSLGPAPDAVRAALARYAEAIAGAGWHVDSQDDRLIVRTAAPASPAASGTEG